MRTAERIGMLADELWTFAKQHECDPDQRAWVEAVKRAVSDLYGAAAIADGREPLPPVGSKL